MDDPVDDVPGWWIATSSLLALLLIIGTLILLWGAR